jgi:hypothetical protein
MTPISIPAHFDGERIVLDEPVTLTPETKLLVTVLPAADEDREEWVRLAMQHFADAFGDDEPEYSLNKIIEPNPEYEGR